MKDWQEIVRLYEKDNLYLAEAAQILSRNIAYEVPGLKRQVVKFEQVCEESAKKIQDLTKSEHILVTEHATLCSQLGIKGDNLQQELTEKVKQLPQLQEQAANASTALKKAVNIYGTFTGNEKCLPILRHIIEKGNTTVYEYVKKEAPSSIEAPPIEIQLSPEYAGLSNQNQEIDFGDGGIDFGGDSAIDIDYGDISVEGGGDIDWGITDEPVDSSVASSDFIVAGNFFTISYIENRDFTRNFLLESGQDKGVARGNQALTILDSPVFKDQFIDELMELESFLQMRIFELNAIENSNTFSMLDSASTHDVATITNLLPDIDVVVEKLTNDLIQHLHQLKHSARYADILAEKLQQKLIAIEKNKATRVLLKEKIEELKVQREQTKPRIERMIEQTKILQDQVIFLYRMNVKHFF